MQREAGIAARQCRLIRRAFLSAILGILSAAGAADPSHDPATDDLAKVMLAAMGPRGGFGARIARAGGATLAAACHRWEIEAHADASPLLVSDGPLLVAADATLYYQADLRRRLSERGVMAGGDSAAHLILAAYRAWGAGCAECLEGDWAFIVWDREQRTVFCARDFAGKRPLFYAQVGETLIVASRISAVLAHPSCPRDLNLTAIAADAAGLFAVADETAYRAVTRLPAGGSLIREGSSPLRRQYHWTPPRIHAGNATSFEDGAHELRELLCRAVAERLPPNAQASIWLSGGWDSTAVFAAGEVVVRQQNRGEGLLPVSLSYPPGDPGREDDLIRMVAARWDRPVRWLDVHEIPLLADPLASASRRDEPFAHAFEALNRALASEGAAAGTRVAFDGSGGDQLFQVTQVYFADLFRDLRWVHLRREWRRRGLAGTGARNFFRWAVQPVLPGVLLSLAAALRGGRALRGYLERPLPAWMNPRFVREHSLVEREKAHAPRASDSSRADAETHWFLAHPYFPRAFCEVAGMALEAGVELRSPLYDGRIIEFAASRPREERASGNESKRLLRASMRGLLPAEILAPRRSRTGISGGYLDHALRVTHAPLLDSLLTGPLHLAELAIVDADVLRRDWSRYRRQGGGELAVNLLLTMHAELWLRVRETDHASQDLPL